MEVNMENEEAKNRLAGASQDIEDIGNLVSERAELMKKAISNGINGVKEMKKNNEEQLKSETAAVFTKIKNLDIFGAVASAKEVINLYKVKINLTRASFSIKPVINSIKLDEALKQNSDNLKREVEQHFLDENSKCEIKEVDRENDNSNIIKMAQNLNK